MLLRVEDKIAALTAIPANHGEVRLPCPAAGLLLHVNHSKNHTNFAAWLKLLNLLQPFNVLRYQPGQHYDSQ